MVGKKKDPLADLLALQEKMNRLFEDTLLPESPPGEGDGAEWSPLADVFETPAELSYGVDLPGVAREAVEVFFERNVITVKGVREIAEVANSSYHRVERPRGRFCLRLALPAGWDAGRIEASHRDGVLTIRVPRLPDSKSREIKIT